MSAAQLPPPSKAAQQASDALVAQMKEEILAHSGFLPFARYMQLALYHPQYGYYTGGAHKIGQAGDFITAPELTPLFGQTLARQIAPLLQDTNGEVYEFGAGTGALAATLIPELSGSLKRYHIIEVSPELTRRQQVRLQQALSAEQFNCIDWNQRLPEKIEGVLIGNEVLDAMPCDVVRYEGVWQEMGVGLEHQQLVWCARVADEALAAEAALYCPEIMGYTTELHRQPKAFIHMLASKLERGAMIWIDYGFDAASYYHPQRAQGTLMGHYRHHAIHNPFFLPGLTDLTAHVNFTALADVACPLGLDLIGYSTQADFLLNLGYTDLLAQIGESDSEAYIRAAAAAQTLLSSHEMGELFKVMAFGKDVMIDWQGFARGDICHKL